LPIDGLGPVIRAHRLKRRITGSELARRAQVTKGLISQIERGTTVPSLDVLSRIAVALDMSMAQLMEAVDAGPDYATSAGLGALPYDPVVRVDRRRSVGFPKINQVYESLTPTLAGPIEFSILHIGPLSAEATLTYSHQGQECLLILEGALVVTLGDRQFHLNVGDSMAYPSTIPHSYRCAGEAPAVVVMAETPPAFLDLLSAHLEGQGR
jgi:transcriptional regulator with XRE-family HTH domain